MIGIYCIENTKNGRRYIGQSIHIEKRINDHRSSLNRKDHNNVYLQRAWNKYGENNFSFFVLIECHQIYLDKLESYCISHYKTSNYKFGYNLESGGNKNKIMSEETKKKISKSRLGKDTMSDQAKERMRKRLEGNTYRLGSKMSEDNKQKLIQAHMGNQYTLGYKHTEESKKKMSEKHKGNKYNLGRHQSDDSKKKKSEASKRFWQNVSNEVKEKMLSNLRSRRPKSVED